MNIVVFDDEEYFCNELLQYIDIFFRKHTEYVYSSIAFSDYNKFNDFILQNNLDVIFLDIAVPRDENYGIDIAKTIRNKNKDCHIIFTTSHNDLIYKAVESCIRPTKYIVKPFDFNKIQELLYKIYNEYKEDNRIIVKTGKNNYIVKIKEILYIEKVERKTLITLYNRKLEVSDTLKNIAPDLTDRFIKIDKGIIVNSEMVKEFNYLYKYIIMTDNQKLYFSRSSKQKLKELENKKK